MDSFMQFMQSVSGRMIRIILGIALLALGIVIGGVWGIVAALIGLVPLAAGLLGVCLFAPLFGYTLTGQKRAGPIGS